MKKTTVNFPLTNRALVYNHPIAFLGSCFSENISNKLKQSGFDVMDNPLGVVFNPDTIGKWLLSSENELTDTIFLRDDVWLSWWCNSSVYAMDEGEMKQRLTNEKRIFLEKLTHANYLFVTFGTAWTYRLKKTGSIVGNCHKQPQTLFEKELLAINEQVKLWREVLVLLTRINPELHVVFTVSPIRHTKDGVVENSRSKSRLLEMIHILCESNQKATYLPIYEFFMDELRDYSYYKEDGIHPNEFAVNEVWEVFRSLFFNRNTIDIYDEYVRLKGNLNHRTIHPESKSSQVFRQKAEGEWEKFLKQYPYVRC
jgi:hypothetical protein